MIPPHSYGGKVRSNGDRRFLASFGQDLEQELRASGIERHVAEVVKSDAFAAFVQARPWLARVRTRYRSPQTNGVSKFYGSVKDEHLYRQEVPCSVALAAECEKYRRTYNEIRPHEHLGFVTPMQVYLADPTKPRPTPAEMWRR